MILHRWRQNLPEAEIKVERVNGDAPDEVRYRGALYERIPGTLPPTYSFVREEK